ncbi:MAG: hypothetical protein PVI90_08755 [Desulfobacteraceae bacterium]|jgi:DNA-binding response OmpR family regulator
MTLTIANTTGIVLLAAPEEQGVILSRSLIAASVECMHACDAESFLSLVQNVYPIAILIDLGLSEDDCRQILTELDIFMEGRKLAVLLLAQIEDKEKIKKQLLSNIRDVVFKPIQTAEVIARIEFAVERLRKGSPDGLNEAGRRTILAARKACHELNQPLQYIMGSVQLALLDLAPKDPIYEVMNGLRQQSERMAQVAANLMHLIRSIS